MVRGILVTGALGQIGSELVSALRQKYRGATVIASDCRLESSDVKNPGPFELVDVTKKSELRRVIEKYKIDEIYHLAGILSAIGEKDPQRAWDVNVEGLKNVLDMSVEYKIEKVFWPSSIAVYGETAPKHNASQNTILEPTTMYGVSKLAGENLCHYYFRKYGLDVRVLRYPGLISWKKPPGGGTTDYAVSIFYEALQKKEYGCFVREDTVLPMMYIDDAIRGTIELMEADASDLTVRTGYNQAAISFSAKELSEQIKKYVPDLVVRFMPDERQKIADSWPRVIDDSKAREDWKWKHEYDLPKITEIMIKNLRNKLGINENTDGNLKQVLKKELERIDLIKTTKRNEIVIEGFEKDGRNAPKAIINGKKYSVFNSNDYLGLRFNDRIKKSEEEASERYGCGPGAVRFISGTMRIHKELEKELADFHGREDAMIFSSAFAANMAVIHCFIRGQSRDSLVGGDSLIISDELNHRSIIDGVRVGEPKKENKAIFKHLDIEDLKRVLRLDFGKFKRAIVVTDGIFSMLGEYQDLAKLNDAVREFEGGFDEGIITIVDDSHGVASFGQGGRGCEEFCNSKCDLLIATMGKGFGTDGGYVVGDKIYIDYLRESAATYIYSNPISPGTAGAALQSVRILNSEEGRELIRKLNENINYFKSGMKAAGFKFAANSEHAIQPILIGDPVKTKELVDALFNLGIVVTNISYPVVPKGRDEIRVQISAAHTMEDLDECIKKFKEAGQALGLIFR